MSSRENLLSYRALEEKPNPWSTDTALIVYRPADKDHFECRHIPNGDDWLSSRFVSRTAGVPGR